MGDPVVELRIKGTSDLSGEFKGKGELTVSVTDAAKARLVVDYKRPDSIVVSLDSTVGLKLSADDSLVLSGGLTQDLINGEIQGRVSAHLRIAKDLSAELEQRFGASGPTTSFELRLKL